MSQRFVVTPAAAGAGDPYPTAALEPLRVDALPILRYGREPGRYGRWRDPDVPFAARGRPGRRAQSDRGSLWGGGRWERYGAWPVAVSLVEPSGACRALSSAGDLDRAAVGPRCREACRGMLGAVLGDWLVAAP